MKILLVNSIAKNHMDCFNLGTAMLATILKNAGYDVEIIDFNYLFHQGMFSADTFEEPDLHTFGSYLLAKSPDVISFYTMCNAYHVSILTAKYIRDHNPSVFIAMGGPQASASAVETMRAFPWIDLIGLGEGEMTILNIVKAIENKTSFAPICGVCYREAGSVRLNPNNEIIENLDTLPMIDYSLVPGADKMLQASIEVGRGCPFGCKYCSTKSFWKRRFRLKSTDRIINEIDYLKENYSITKFSLVHDLFTVNKRKIQEFCDRLINDKLNIEWSCSSRVDTLDEDTIGKMSQAGCTAMFLGIETGSDRMQKLINKNLKLNRILDTVRLLKKYGIAMKVSFIYGFPEESLTDIRSTLNLIADLTAEGVRDTQLHRLSLLCDTEFFEEYFDRLIFVPNRFSSDFNNGSITDSFKDLILKHPGIFPNYFTINNPNLEEDEFLSLFICYYHSFLSGRLPLTCHYLMQLYKKDLYALYKDFRGIIEQKIDSLQDYLNYKNFDKTGYMDEIIRSFELFFELRHFDKDDDFIKNVFRFERNFIRFAFFDHEKDLFETAYDYDVLTIKKEKLPLDRYMQEETKIRFLRDEKQKIRIQKLSMDRTLTS